MKTSLLSIFAGCLLFTAGALRAQNYNNCIQVEPTPGSFPLYIHTNGHIAISGLSLDTGNFTVEMWTKLDSRSYSGTSPFVDPPFFCNKDWTNGGNQGIAIAVYTGGTYKVNFTPAGHSRLDKVSSGPGLIDRWSHIAISVDRHGFIRMYTNGVLTDSMDISSYAGSTIDASHPYYVCDDGTGDYTYTYFSGLVDEVRVWNTARTTAQIRQYMCQRIPAPAENTQLILYYDMNQALTSGTTVNDLSSGGHTGTMEHIPSTNGWMSSGAPVGDSSAYLYNPSTWTGASVTVPSPANGIFSADSMDNTMEGIQVYRTFYPPYNTTGITGIYSSSTGDSIYYGVYPVSEMAGYKVSYDYNDYVHAVGLENFIRMFKRVGNDPTTSWSAYGATNSIATHTFHSSFIDSNYNQYVIGNFSWALGTQQISSSNNEIIEYPNPITHEVINLDSKHHEDMTVNIFNMAGILVKSVTITAWPYSMNIADLANGNYLVNCNNSNRNENFQISIVK